MKQRYLKILDIGHSGNSPDEAMTILETTVSQCSFENKTKAIKVITGHGSGRLRQTVREWCDDQEGRFKEVIYGEGHSEKIIGSMWDEISRKEIFLATKVGWDKGPNKNWYDPDYMSSKMHQSLKNLKTECIDLLYLHHCNFGKNDEHLDEAIEQISRFKDEGKTRFIGLSDWSAKRIMKFINHVNPDVVQPLYNVNDIEYELSGLKNYVKINNLGVCFFSPIKHGILTGKYDAIPDFPKGDFRKTVKEFKNIDFKKK